ncbi:invasion associated locus B family protein [Acuticoccus sp. I52.16.1]|uniref:invasion associated locus B family protein n=1 Tax=Acuticoccus sp. I52.16.1 TaxID=2928472 RepID=UPI001FD0F0FD|nr:invasion associated locus B family protein [Acuticoccus sp. I52.16.1]UOM32840.1 invasion associated locus B family protein [Acuticoccus sp. I52.16.1]
MRRAAVKLSIAAAAALTGVAPAGAQPVLPPAPVIATYGAWALECEHTVGVAVDSCAATQTAAQQVGDPDAGGVVLTVLFVRGEGGSVEVMRVLAPLGVLLPSGLSLSVDGAEVGVAGFVRCLPPGCISEVALGEGLREALVAGRTAQFAVSLTPQSQAAVRVSLDGLGDALDALATASVSASGNDGAGAPDPDTDQ